MENENYAYEWFRRGTEEDDPIIKFMFYWIAFNWLYNECRYTSKITEPDLIISYWDNNFGKLSKYDAFSTKAVEIFLKDPIGDAVQGVTHKRENLYNSLRDGTMREKSISLILSIYYVRCNLFHGSKRLREERDFQLVEASSIIMEGYLNTVLTKPTH